ncbi:tRNA1(Val) A37 N6-methylase TrmN6 [Salsuginibacillus halophilus]|uniref:tRNA1(Val) A37 N6-methylase TrmN6 n=1 Tax=Salsuginibacillus halophilus TaxID=517424 RepID=A0A2P8H7P3_9BACI|nr:tRNA1(Val) (adenine(37)-N6)-methyltransferase [Salsuginibacillus halophilus]PSL42236.1 tRNA1(Val) A37 N6-methylase TrmN6 [Salsuginibacillus halophilus]
MNKETPPLEKDERIDRINDELSIIQSSSVFSFSIDSVLLARFTSVAKTRGEMMDLGTGNGVVPLVLSSRSAVSITGLEIQPRLADMARRSVELNACTSQIKIDEGDLRKAPEVYGRGRFDVVTSNPPYFRSSQKELQNENPHLRAARHEYYSTLEDIAHTAGQLLRDRGKFSLCYRPERLAEVIQTCARHRLEPKRLQLIHPAPGKEANLMLLEMMKNGGAGLSVEPPLTVFDEARTYTKEFLAQYG